MSPEADTKDRAAARLYEGRDPRSLPAYTSADAARYLSLPASTVGAWTRGQPYRTARGEHFFEPLIERPAEDSAYLSFTNLVELHVLSAIRRVHRVSMAKVRAGLDYLQSHLQVEHPLASVDFQTDGVDLFVEKFGQLLAVSSEGQGAFREILEAHLRRIERDEERIASRLYPFTRTSGVNQPKIIVIDPRVSFGRPVIHGTGVTTAILAERYKAGESIDDLAADYGCGPPSVEEAIRCELELAA